MSGIKHSLSSSSPPKLKQKTIDLTNSFNQACHN
jgi:hypothetical protein